MIQLFRVWDLKKKKFLDPSCFAVLGTGKLIVSESGYYNHFTNVNNEDYLICRYTGLTDSKGTPIYEGDIIRQYYHYTDDLTETPEFIGVVKHKTYKEIHTHNQVSCFVAYPDTNMDEKKCICAPIKINCEVIGDIMNNPELLK